MSIPDRIDEGRIVVNLVADQISEPFEVLVIELEGSHVTDLDDDLHAVLAEATESGLPPEHVKTLSYKVVNWGASGDLIELVLTSPNSKVPLAILVWLAKRHVRDFAPGPIADAVAREKAQFALTVAFPVRRSELTERGIERDFVTGEVKLQYEDGRWLYQASVKRDYGIVLVQARGRRAL